MAKVTKWMAVKYNGFIDDRLYSKKDDIRGYTPVEISFDETEEVAKCLKPENDKKYFNVSWSCEGEGGCCIHDYRAVNLLTENEVKKAILKVLTAESKRMSLDEFLQLINALGVSKYDSKFAKDQCTDLSDYF